MSDLLSAKRDLRRAMQDRRAFLAAGASDAALRLQSHFLKHIRLPGPCAVAFYHARGDEMNPAPLATALHGMGYTLALPVVTARGAPLVFRSYEPGDKLAPGSMSIPEPLAEAPAVEPDILLVPLLAFDRHGNRLGYGGGYYDRSLTALRKRKAITAVGIAYAGQEVPEVPVELHDVRLDYIITEAGIAAP